MYFSIPCQIMMGLLRIKDIYTNINLSFELCKLITGKQIGTPQLPKAQLFISPIMSPILSISQLLKLFYFSTISYLDCWEKIDNLFTDGNREKIISSRLFFCNVK